MPIVLTLIVAIVVFVFLSVAPHSAKDIKGISDKSAPVISESPELSQIPTPTPTVFIRKESPPPTGNPIQNIDWSYPGSTLSGDNTYQSSDSPTEITIWYKDKIKSQGYSTTTSITNVVNGSIDNMLSGTRGNDSVSVEISKSQNDTHTKIILTLKENLKSI